MEVALGERRQYTLRGAVAARTLRTRCCFVASDACVFLRAPVVKPLAKNCCGGVCRPKRGERESSVVVMQCCCLSGLGVLEEQKKMCEVAWRFAPMTFSSPLGRMKGAPAAQPRCRKYHGTPETIHAVCLLKFFEVGLFFPRAKACKQQHVARQQLPA